MEAHLAIRHPSQGSKTDLPKTAGGNSNLRDNPQKSEAVLKRVAYFLYTIYLFTKSDIPTTLVQMLLFGVSGAASGLLTGDASTTPQELIRNLPWTGALAWCLLLVVQLGNQSIPGGLEEDALNKPWRPIPSGRISREGAHALRLPAAVLALVLGWSRGAHAETAAFVFLVYVYNDWGGSDDLIIRNLCNGSAITLVAQSALRSAAYPTPMMASGYIWSLSFSAVIATTVQVQDFRDQEGDGARDRRTLPLAVGDESARWLTVAPLMAWALICPAICGAGVIAYSLSLVTGLHTVYNLLAYRTPAADHQTYKLFSRWLGVISVMPFLSLLAW